METAGDDKLEKLKELIKNTNGISQKLTSENIFLRRFLKVSDNDEEKAHKLLVANLKFRKTAPHVFTDRDVMSEAIKNACAKGIQFLPLPRLTRNKLKVTILRYPTTDTSLYNLIDAIKMILMSIDARSTLPDEQNDLISDGEIYIVDVQNYTFKHFLKALANLSTANIFTQYTQNVAQVELKQAHIVNPSWIIDKFMTLMKPVVKKELLEMLKMHSSGYESLLEFIDEECLPEEYGGTLGKFDNLFSDWMKVFESKRDFVMDEDIWKIS